MDIIIYRPLTTGCVMLPIYSIKQNRFLIGKDFTLCARDVKEDCLPIFFSVMPYVNGADIGVCHENPWVGEPL